KARQVDLLYLGQRHLMLVFTSMFFALLVGIPSGILLSRPAANGTFHVGQPLRALNMLLRVGHSPMSNEIVLSAAFAALGGLGAL
ncbi:dimethyl sulfoxide reductase anchor subunit, partial [Salmonella enterica subsp. enterica serovar Lubbock]|nr:dimethyl sulfoxide reductase anchor subunit [Salmonella enterica subsp. enterica serovar Lubbock]